MKQTNLEYGKLVSEKVSQLGVDTVGMWSQCFRTNSTYLDCPIADFTNNEKFQMNVAVHNPAAFDIKGARIAVPDTKFSVEVLDLQTGKFV